MPPRKWTATADGIDPIVRKAHSSGMNQGLEQRGGQFFYNGKPILIVSADCETLVADTRYKIGASLDTLIRHGFNKIRLWGHCWHGGWTGPPEVFLRPWKSVPGAKSWNEQKWDLDQWNDAYWSRMREFCQAALERDFIVEISLFAEWTRNFPEFCVRGIRVSDWWQDELARPIWNRRFNVNGVFTTNAEGDFWPEFCNLDHPEKSTSGRTLRDYQQAYLDKALREFDGFPNVYYEFFNEFAPFPQSKEGPAGIDEQAGWQNHWAEYLKQHSKRLIGVCAHQIGAHQCETVGVQNFQDKPFIDVLNFHWFGEIEPDGIAALTRPLHRFGKALAHNEGEWYGVTAPAMDMEVWLQRTTRRIWGMFMAGLHYSLTDFPPDVETDRWNRMAARFKAWHTIAASTRFWELRLVDDNEKLFDSLIAQGPTNQWRLIANPGREYVAYFWGERADSSVTLTVPHGRYRAVWYDTCNAQKLASEKLVAAGGNLTIPAVSGGDTQSGLVLHLVAQS